MSFPVVQMSPRSPRTCHQVSLEITFANARTKSTTFFIGCRMLRLSRGWSSVIYKTGGKVGEKWEAEIVKDRERESQYRQVGSIELMFFFLDIFFIYTYIQLFFLRKKSLPKSQKLFFYPIPIPIFFFCLFILSNKF